MNTEKANSNQQDQIPILIRVALIAIAALINLPILFKGFSPESIGFFLLFVAKNLLFVPAVFLIVGVLLKLRDDSFKLTNAYYLGVFIAIVLTVQSTSTTIV